MEAHIPCITPWSTTINGTPTKGTVRQSGRKSSKNQNLKNSYTQVVAGIEKIREIPQESQQEGQKTMPLQVKW